MLGEHYDLQWLWITVGMLSVAFVIFLMYYGLFPSQEPTHQIMNGMTIIYTEAQCKYPDLGSAFLRMWKEVRMIGNMKTSRCVGIYFDNPSLIKQPHMARSAIGLVLETREQVEAASEFVKRSHRYRIRSLPEVECLSLRVPFRNILTYFIIPIFWNRMNKNSRSGNSSVEHEAAGIEVYEFRESRNNIITLNIPVEKREAFAFSSFPRPEYKR